MTIAIYGRFMLDVKRHYLSLHYLIISRLVDLEIEEQLDFRLSFCAIEQFQSWLVDEKREILVIQQVNYFVQLADHRNETMECGIE